VQARSVLDSVCSGAGQRLGKFLLLGKKNAASGRAAKTEMAFAPRLC